MRILLAIDGSAHSARARQLVASVRWPAGSALRLVTAVEPAQLMLGGPWAPTVASQLEVIAHELRSGARQVLDEAATELAGTGCTIKQELIDGRPASAIIDGAGEWAAQLIVMGSRGHGRIGTMLLGSVTAEVVDHAACHVLVARRSSIDRLVLAHDGSSYARAAEQLLVDWPIFADSSVDVVSVAPGSGAWRSGLPVSVAAEALGSQNVAEAALHEHQALAADAESRLRSAGLRAKAVVVQGEPAEAIMRAAEGSRAELILLGTHGRTGLTRALLGSVARNVLLHADCSVLIARQPRAETN